jgi:hypothetical protein
MAASFSTIRLGGLSPPTLDTRLPTGVSCQVMLPPWGFSEEW